MPSSSKATSTSKMRSGPWASPRAHVVEPVLDQAHGPAEPARQMRHQHRLLDAALDAVAAADVDVLVHAHVVGRNAQRARDLVGIFRHLDRGPDVEHVAPRIPGRDDAERLDRNRRAAAPGHAERQMPRALGEMFVRPRPRRRCGRAARWSRARDEPAGCPARSASSAFDHERQRLIVDVDLFGGVFGERAAVGDHRRDPFAGVAGLPDRERIAPHVRRIEAVHQRIDRRGELLAGQHVVHARHRQRGGGIDRDDARGRMLRRQHRHMQHAVERDVGDVMAVARDEAAVLANAAVGRDEAEGRGIGAHFASATVVPGLRRPRQRRIGAAQPLGGELRSPRRSARSRCSGRYCPRSPRRYPRASALALCCSSACADRIMPGVQ